MDVHLGLNSLNNFQGGEKNIDLNDSRRFFSAVEYSLQWLEANSEAINRLNVYPVPDGDTGTNMVLTLRAAVREAGGGALVPLHPRELAVLG